MKLGMADDARERNRWNGLDIRLHAVPRSSCDGMFEFPPLSLGAARFRVVRQLLTEKDLAGVEAFGWGGAYDTGRSSKIGSQ